MKIVYSWLKEVVDIHVPAEELADALTGAGLEVASIKHLHVPAGVVVAKVLEAGRHPNADRLSVCKVDVGGPEPLTIVCGAPNVTAGMVAPLATIGAVLGPDMTVKQAKIRGVESFGMLCSQRELGLSDDHSGIMPLPAHYKIGDELSTYYPDDAVIEIEIVPSRGDCLSIVGVAREVSARYGLPLKTAGRLPAENAADPVSSAISVEIEAPEACPRYAGRLVRNVTIQPSPEWMQRRLTLAGLRPINNVVDVTNYMMLHYGQPMHAFDYQSIKGRKIVVRKAGSPAPFVTLDNTERKLQANDLLICDAERPVALAGIMGGAGSEISSATTEVFLECAFFLQSGIRKSSKRLGLSTDSSYRFERGVDPDTGLLAALDTAAALIAELGGGQAAAGRIDVVPRPFEKRTIRLRPSRVNRVLGQEFASEKISGFLSSIGIDCEPDGAEAMRCVIPLFRHDITGEEDLIEEVGRLYGYNSIPAADHAFVTLGHSLPVTEQTADTIRYALAYGGMNEITTNSLTSEKNRLLCTPGKKPVVLLNPLSPEMAEMRTTLAPSMLQVLAYNLNRKNRDNKFFELGKTYETIDVEPGQVDRRETEVLGILIEGNWTPAAWNTTPLPCDFFVFKGVLEAFATRIAAGRMKTAPLDDGVALYDGEAVRVTIGSGISGTAGRVSGALLRQFDIKSTVYYAELEVSAYLLTPRPAPTYKPLPRFPAVERDFCFVMPEAVNAAAIAQEIRRSSALVEGIEPFDLYRGDKLGAGLKSIAYTVLFRSGERTLTEKDAEAASAEIIARVAAKFNAKLRS